MRDVAAIEISAIVNELKSAFDGAYFKNFYELRENAFLLTLSKERKESAMYINLAKAINKTQFKEKIEIPGEFALAVRRKLDGTRFSKIEQHGVDRIVVMSFSGKNEGKMIVEMFGKGNLILVNKENVIELVYKSVGFKERSLRRGMVYSFPVQRGRTTLYETDEKSGAEFKPRIYERNGEIVDFALLPMKKYEEDPEIMKREFATISEMFDELYLKERSTEIDREKNREGEELRKSIEKLRKQISEIRGRGEEYKKVANKIYENMHEINSLLAHVSKNKIRKAEEMGEKFGNIKVKNIDAKRKTVTVEMA